MRARPWFKAPISHLSGVFDRWSSLALTYATRFIGIDLRIAEGALEYMEGRLPSILPMFLSPRCGVLQGAHITRPILSAAIVATSSISF